MAGQITEGSADECLPNRFRDGLPHDQAPVVFGPQIGETGGENDSSVTKADTYVPTVALAPELDLMPPEGVRLLRLQHGTRDLADHIAGRRDRVLGTSVDLERCAGFDKPVANTEATKVPFTARD